MKVFREEKEISWPDIKTPDLLMSTVDLGDQNPHVLVEGAAIITGLHVERVHGCMAWTPR
jgi:hypothetical protein